MYLDINNLRRGRNSEITHKFIKIWKSFDSLVKFAEKTDDVSLMNKIKASDTVKPARCRCPHIRTSMCTSKVTPPNLVHVEVRDPTIYLALHYILC